MKKLIFRSCLFFAIVIFIGACKKDKTTETKTSVTNVLPDALASRPGDYSDDYYADLVLKQSLTVAADYKRFSFVIDKFANNTFSIIQELHNKGGFNLVNQWKSLISSPSNYSAISQFYLQNNIDTSQMFDKKAEILGSLASFYEATPEFNQLDSARQITVFNMVFDSLETESYRVSHSSNPLVITYNNIIAKFCTPANPTARLTMEEVSGCLREAVTGAVVNSMGLVKQLWNVISGYNLGWSGIVRVAKSALQSVVSSSAIGALVGFGVCIAWETFF